MSLCARILAAFTFSSLAGASVAGDETPPTSGQLPSTSGLARVYVLRPEMSSMGKRDSPALVVNGREVGKIDNNTYLELLAPPGVLRYALKPSALASVAWALEGELRVAEGKNYYLAVWTAGEGGSNNGMRLLPALGALPLIPVPAATSVQMRVLTEAIGEAEALEALKDLQRGGNVIELEAAR